MKLSKPIILTIVAVMLTLPLVYLVYHSSQAPDLPVEQPVVVQPQQQGNDIAALETAVKDNPTFDNLINLSMAYINNQMPGRSIDLLKQAIKLNPQSTVAYNNLCVARTMLQQYKEGVEACNMALKIDSSYQLAKNNLAWAADEYRKVQASIQQMEAKPASEKNSAYYLALGLQYMHIGEYDKSKAAWHKVLDNEPNNTVALNNIGSALMMQEKYDEAISYFTKITRLEPDNQLAKNNLAWGQSEKAKHQP